MCIGHWLEPGDTEAIGGDERAATWTAAGAVSPRAIAPGEAAAARAFYCNALRGRQVWPTEDVDGGGSLWFLVGLTLVEVGPNVRLTETPTVLEVDDPTAVAERCWDAGFSVRVRRDGAGETALSLVDPFGRRVDLAAREPPTSPVVAATEEAQRRAHASPSGS